MRKPFLRALTLASLTLTSTLASVHLQASAPVLEAQLPQLQTFLNAHEQQAPAAQENELRREIAKQQKKAAAARRFARINLLGQAGARYQDIPNESTETEFELGFAATLTQPIYHWGALEARETIAKIGWTQAAHQAAESDTQLRADIRLAYLHLIVNAAELEAANLRLEAAESAHAQQTSAGSAGRSSEETLLESTIALEEAKLTQSEVQQEARSLQQNLQRLVGSSENITTLLETTPLPNTIPALEYAAQAAPKHEASAQALQPTHQLQHQALELEKADAKLTQIKARQRPQLDFAARIRQETENTATQNDVETIEYFAGLRMRWNIFDSFETRALKRETLARKRLLQSQQANLVRETAHAQHNTGASLQRALQTQALESAKFELATKRYNVAQANAQTGRLSAQGFTQARATYLEAKASMLSARAAAWESLYEAQALRPTL